MSAYLLNAYDTCEFKLKKYFCVCIKGLSHLHRSKDTSTRNDCEKDNFLIMFLQFPTSYTECSCQLTDLCVLYSVPASLMYYNRLYLIIIASYISAGKYKVVSYNQTSTAQFLKIEMARCLYGMQQILKHICIE